MKTYAYRGFDAVGQARKGLVQADDVKAAREALSRDGILAERLWASGRRERPLGYARRASLYRELAVLLDSGMPVVPALEMLIQAPDLRVAAGRLSAVRDQVREGASLGEALKAVGGEMTDYEQAIVGVAEQSGSIAVVLRRLGVFMESQSRIGESVRGALIYPAFVAAVGLLAGIVMLGVLLPRAQRIMTDAHLPVPVVTGLVVQAGAWVVRWGWVVAAAAVVAVAVGARQWRRSSSARRSADQMLYRLPVVGAGYRLLVNLRFADALAMLLRGGLPLVRALAMAGRATASAWCAALVETETEQVRHGASLAEAIGRVPPLAGEMSGVLHVGQAGGNLAELLEGAVQRLQYRWERFVKRALALLEPLLILIVGGFVLLITLSVLLPVLSLSRAVGR